MVRELSVNHSYDGQTLSSGYGPMQERLLFDSNPSQVRFPGPTGSSSGFHSYCYTYAGNTDFQFQAETHQRSGVQRVVLGGLWCTYDLTSGGRLPPRL